MHKTKHKHRKHRGMLKGGSKAKKVAFVFTALLPLVLGGLWLGVLVAGPETGVADLSPSRSTPLVIALVIFMMGYVVFLSIMFSEDIKDFYDHLVKHKAH